MDKQAKSISFSVSGLAEKGRPSLLTHGLPAPLINTLWLDLISPQCHPSLSVVKQQETAQGGDENMHLREGSRRGRKTSLNSSKTVYFHASLS